MDTPYAPMRRKDRAISREEAMALLVQGEYGVLSTVGEDGLPSGVPLSYVMDGEGICFHCARQGEKIDHLNFQPQVSFAVVGEVQAVHAGDYTTRYESAIAKGRAVRIEDPAEKRRLLKLLCEKYLPAHMDKFEQAMRSLDVTDVWRINIQHLTGKAKR